MLDSSGNMKFGIGENGKVILPEIPELDDQGKAVLDKDGKPKLKKLVDSALEQIQIPKLLTEGKMSKDLLKDCFNKCKKLNSLKKVMNLAKSEKIKSAVSKIKNASFLTKKVSLTPS